MAGGHDDVPWVEYTGGLPRGGGTDDGGGPVLLYGVPDGAGYGAGGPDV